MAKTLIQLKTKYSSIKSSEILDKQNLIVNKVF